MITGTASAPSAARKAGARKFTVSSRDSSSYSAETLSRTQIRKQSLIERLGRIEQAVLHLLLAHALGEQRDVVGYHLLVLLAQVLGDERHLLARLHVDEVASVGEREL